MIQDLEHYLGILKRWHIVIATRCSDGRYMAGVVNPWFNFIAPVKAEEYGIECWMRLGARALIVDINACFYRWKNLMHKPREGNEDAMYNALRDVFGYCIMFCVIRGIEPTEIDWFRVFDDKNSDAINMNESLIHWVWDLDSPKDMEKVALNMAYTMWRLR